MRNCECLNCGKRFNPTSLKNDKLGLHTMCLECGSSFDVKEINTLADYLSDENRVSGAEKERINFQVNLIGKIIEDKEKKNK